MQDKQYKIFDISLPKITLNGYKHDPNFQQIKRFLHKQSTPKISLTEYNNEVDYDTTIEHYKRSNS